MSEHGRFRDKENPEMMHEQQQPKEYIITEEGLKQIKELIFHEDEVKFEKLAWKIISRPHPAPSTVVEDITFEGAAIVQAARKEAARKAREDFAKELLTWLDGHWTLTMVKHYGAWTTEQSLEYKTTINKIKHMSTTPHTEQEQP